MSAQNPFSPVLSIITINYNNGEGLAKTINSVLEQTYSDMEYIIIDGGSTDSSREIIDQNSSRIDYWVSELDQGIYHAMNKGVLQAKGEYLMFLNSGDYLVNPTVLYSVFAQDVQTDILYGNLQTEHTIVTYPRKLDFAFFFRGSIGHVSSFIRRSLFERCGLYNEENILVSDWEFFLNAIILNGASYHYLNQTITFFNSEGLSNQVKNIKVQKAERIRVLTPLFPLLYQDLISELDSLENELQLYRNSRTIKWAKRIVNFKPWRK